MSALFDEAAQQVTGYRYILGPGIHYPLVGQFQFYGDLPYLPEPDPQWRNVLDDHTAVKVHGYDAIDWKR